MKLKAVLADDELPILHNLRNVLPWDRWNIELVALARNGVEALEAVREHDPDILLTDIRMPVMDGMTLLAEVRKLSTHCEILMLTGYQEFEYARTALQYKVRDYILKPIDYDKLGQTVEEMAETIRARRLAERLAEEKHSRSAGLVYEKIVYDVLMGRPPEEVRLSLTDAGVAIDRLSYDMILVEAIYEPNRGTVMETESAITGQAPTSLDFVLDGLLRQSLASFALKPLLVKLGEGQWLILIDQRKTEHSFLTGRVNVDAWLPALIQTLMIGCKAKVRVNIYPQPVPFAELSAAFDSLRRMQEEHALTSHSSNKSGAEELYDGEAMSKRRGEQLIGKAGEYIRRNLTSDIGIEEVAGHLGISCSYFSMLFKAHFGETFVEHVTRQRMEMAMNMLLTTDRSITRIGMLVGYSERRYFTKVFQKYAHVTPSEFREAGKNRSGNE